MSALGGVRVALPPMGRSRSRRFGPLRSLGLSGHPVRSRFTPESTGGLRRWPAWMRPSPPQSRRPAGCGMPRNRERYSANRLKKVRCPGGIRWTEGHRRGNPPATGPEGTGRGGVVGRCGPSGEPEGGCGDGGPSCVRTGALFSRMPTLALQAGGFLCCYGRLVRVWFPGVTPTRRVISAASALGSTSCRQEIGPFPTSRMVVVMRIQWCRRLRMEV